MKKIFLTIIVLFTFFLYGIAQKQNPKVIVYYFHATHRCNTCIEIENKTKLVLFQDFKDELINGIIQFQSFDYEDPTNQKIVKKYFAYGSTLLLVYPSDETKNVELTEVAFQYVVNKPEKFKEILSQEIEKLIQSN